MKKQNSHRGNKPQRGILTEADVFTPYINDILSKFHEVKSCDETRVKIFMETNDLYKRIEKIKGEIKTLVSVDNSKQLESYHQNQENSTKIEKITLKDLVFNMEDKENINTMNYSNSLELHGDHNNYSSSPVFPMKQKNLKESVVSEPEKVGIGKYEVTYEKVVVDEKNKDNNQNLLTNSMVSSKCFHQNDIAKNSNSLDCHKICSGNQTDFAFKSSESFKNPKFQLNKREVNQLRESIQNDLVVHDTNSSHIIDPAYLESGGSSLQYLSGKKGSGFLRL